MKSTSMAPIILGYLENGLKLFVLDLCWPKERIVHAYRVICGIITKKNPIHQVMSNGHHLWPKMNGVMLKNNYHVLPPKSIDVPFMPYALKCIILTTQNFEKKNSWVIVCKGWGPRVGGAHYQNKGPKTRGKEYGNLSLTPNEYRQPMGLNPSKASSNCYCKLTNISNHTCINGLLNTLGNFS
jgi:hypothetical protein